MQHAVRGSPALRHEQPVPPRMHAPCPSHPLPHCALALLPTLQRNFSTYVFRLKLYEDTYQDVAKIKASVQSLAPVDWAKEGHVSGPAGGAAEWPQAWAMAHTVWSVDHTV